MMENKSIIAALLILFVLPFAFAAGSDDKGSDNAQPTLVSATAVPATTQAGSGTFGEMVQTQTQLNAQEMNQLSEQVSIKAGSISSDGQSGDMIGKQILVRVQNSDITIESTQNMLQIRDGNTVVNAEEVQLRNGKMYLGDTEITATPSQITERIQEREQNREQIRENVEIRLEESNGKAVYAHYAIEQRKLFGFFSMRATINEQFSAETGDFIKEVHPWWYALSSAASTQ